MGQFSHLYGSRWRKERAAFLRANPLCRMCKEQSKRTMPAAVVDHRIPHKGDLKLFWDQKNWQSLCFTHHNAHAQQRDKSGTVRGCGPDGRPHDPRHHWNVAPAQRLAEGAIGVDAAGEALADVRSGSLERSREPQADGEGTGGGLIRNGASCHDRSPRSARTSVIGQEKGSHEQEA